MSTFKKPSASQIHLLDSQTINQIAAGEVVERPVSVIKELVENSIDANASKITIKLFGQQLQKLQVTDNGEGMNAQAIIQSVKRHATSKIRRLSDLDNLMTMGFRGEALPSIASVSQMTITSHSREELSGYTITVKNGKPSIPQEVGAPYGTTMIVDRLFSNTPARLKFLKSARWELGLISELIGRLAISLPQIAFVLKHDDKVILRTSGSGELNQAVLAVYGTEVLQQLVEVEWVQNMVVHGLVSLPQLSRANRNHYSFFVNNRWIKNRDLTRAVDEAYYTILPEKRYPIVMIFLQLSPSFFDVNVHPAKLEIRFKDVCAVKETVRDAIIQALKKKAVAQPKLAQLNDPPDPIISKEGFKIHEQEQNSHKDLEQFLHEQSEDKQSTQTNSGLSRALFSQAHQLYREAEIQQSAEAEKTTATKVEPEKDFIFSSLRSLGQIDGTYIIATAHDRIYFIDQHAAHERIRYEKMLKMTQEEKAASSQLAVPITVELTHQESLWLTDRIIQLTDMGFLLEHFGDNTFILRGVPLWYQGSDGEFLLRQVIELHHNNNKSLRQEELFLAACKSAVKGNKFLTDSDILNIFSELDKCDNPNTCPHGRPVIIHLEMDKIRRTFLRTSI